MTFAIYFVSGCTSNQNHSLNFSKITAVYLTLKSGGQLSQSDLSAYPQVVTVYTFKQLKNDVDSSNHPLEIWIDKNALTKIPNSDLDWLINKARDHYLFGLIGYNNSLYAFRDKLGLYGMQGPSVDWSKMKLQPGFSLAMYQSDGGTHFKIFKGIPTCTKILSYAGSLKAQDTKGK